MTSTDHTSFVVLVVFPHENKLRHHVPIGRLHPLTHAAARFQRIGQLRFSKVVVLPGVLPASLRARWICDLEMLSKKFAAVG